MISLLICTIRTVMFFIIVWKDSETSNKRLCEFFSERDNEIPLADKVC